LAAKKCLEDITTSLIPDKFAEFGVNTRVNTNTRHCKAKSKVNPAADGKDCMLLYQHDHHRVCEYMSGAPVNNYCVNCSKFVVVLPLVVP
jgi:hypothetical protein